MAVAVAQPMTRDHLLSFAEPKTQPVISSFPHPLLGKLVFRVTSSSHESVVDAKVYASLQVLMGLHGSRVALLRGATCARKLLT